MIIDRSRCDGCGTCVDACPTGAIFLQDGLAVIDAGLCNECAACQSSCPQDAILSAEVIEPAQAVEIAQPVSVPQPSQMVETKPQAVTPSLRTSIVPAFASAILATGREILPRLASLALDSLDRRLQANKPVTRVRRSKARDSGQAAMGGRGRQRRLRRRRRNRP